MYVCMCVHCMYVCMYIVCMYVCMYVCNVCMYACIVVCTNSCCMDRITVYGLDRSVLMSDITDSFTGY